MAIEQRELSVSISELIPWMEAHPATTGAIVAFVVVILGWFSGLFKWMWIRVFKGKDRRSESDPQALTKALHRYEELIETKDTLRETEEKVKDLTAALEIAQSIARGGGELAKEAQALLDVFVAQPDDPTLPAQFDGLIDDYENGPVNDLIALYLGRGAVSYMNDPRGVLAAYTRVTQLNPDHEEAHNRCGNLHFRLGNLTAAQAAYDTVRRLAEAEKDDEFKATALGNLGNLAQTRGDLAAAEEYYDQSLTLNQELGRKEGMANQYGNLGGLARIRGDLTASEGYYEQSLKLNQELGRKEGMAINYGNLGVLAATRGDLAAAEEYYEQSLTLNQELGLKEGMANQYGNLGILARTRGDLAAAEGYYAQSLTLNQALGRKEGMAINYGNLGRLEHARGNMAGARAFWVQARDLYAEIGMPHMVKQLQGWIDSLDG